MKVSGAGAHPSKWMGSIFCTSLNAVQNGKPVLYFEFSFTLTAFEPALNTDASVVNQSPCMSCADVPEDRSRDAVGAGDEVLLNDRYILRE